MNKTTAQLRSIEKPGRYFSPFIFPEMSVPSDSPDMLLLFPDLFEVAQSHTGLKIIYQLLQERGVGVDFGFAAKEDMLHALRQSGDVPRSLLFNRPFSDFSVIGVSFQYTLQFPTLLTLLKYSDIPLRAHQRNEQHPIVIAGGPVMVNPEPVASFLDAVFAGEIEAFIDDIARAVRGDGKNNILNLLKDIPAVYSPSAEVEPVVFDEKGTVTSPFSCHAYPVPNLDDVIVPSTIPLFGLRTVHDRHVVEIMRGCTRGCRFCMAGSFYRPHRERSYESVKTNVLELLDKSGYDQAGFLSLSSSDHACINDLIALHRELPIYASISLPSLRTETVNDALLKVMPSGRKGSFTIAPESGSERLRRVINKGNTTADLLAAVHRIFSAKWTHIKLYFMLGLPTETDKDIEETIFLLRQVSDIAREYGKKHTVTASISTFVPQPLTPFQWEEMIPLSEIHRRQKMIISAFRNSKNITIKWHEGAISIVEGYLSRAGREMADVIEYVAEKSDTLQSWDEGFDFSLWEEALQYHGVDGASLLKEKNPEKPLPWEHMDFRFDRRWLLTEREKAYKEAETADCAFTGICTGCGVCDFKEIMPRRDTTPPEKRTATAKRKTVISQNKGNGFPWHISFSKSGRSLSLGHLDTMNFLIKGFIHLQLPLLYSEGFHPMPRIAMINPLPLGVEAEEEIVSVWFTDTVDVSQLLDRLNTTFSHSGIQFISAVQLPREGIKKREKLMRNYDPIPYEAVFSSAVAAQSFAEKLSAEAVPRTVDHTLFFLHSQKTGGSVLKLFESYPDEYHLKRMKYYNRHF